MTTKLTWKRGFFKQAYEIFSGSTLLGTFSGGALKKKAVGELNGKKFEFKTSGFFKQTTEIIDKNSETAAGRIIYNTWNTKAEVELFSGSNFHWQYNNLWNTKWNLSGEDVSIDYKGSASKGDITFNQMNEQLILTGLYISNFYLQNTIVVAVAIIIPILAAASH